MLERLSISHYLTENYSVKPDKVLYTCLTGKNVMGADNQQERLDPQWVAGKMNTQRRSRILRDHTPEQQ